MIYMKHPKLGNGHFPVEQLEELEAQGWVWWPHGDYLTRPSNTNVPSPREAEVVSSPPSLPLPASGGTPKRSPGRPRKAAK